MYYDENKVSKLNQKATGYGQFSTNSGIVYKDMQLRHDLLDFEDSDEESIENFLDFQKTAEPKPLDIKQRPKTQHGHHLKMDAPMEHGLQSMVNVIEENSSNGNEIVPATGRSKSQVHFFQGAPGTSVRQNRLKQI